MRVIKLKTQVGADGEEFQVQAKGLALRRDVRSFGWWAGVGWTRKKVGEDVDPCDVLPVPPQILFHVDPSVTCFQATLSLASAALHVPVSNRVLAISEPNTQPFRWDEIIRILPRKRNEK